MKRMPHPVYSHQYVAEKIRDSMDPNPRINTLRPLVQECIDNHIWIRGENLYTTAANTGNLSILSRCNVGTKDRPLNVFGQLTKSNMVNLYDAYLRNEEKPDLRVIYDSIKNAAEDECPYCAGLSTDVDTLDHYLPKSVYPRFAVLPPNLVPACATCNTLMKASSSNDPGQQFLHPYSDADNFFNEQWLFAEYSLESKEINFIVNAPEHWNNTEKQRVRYHFEQLELADRLRKRAVRELAGGLRQFDKARERNPALSINEAIEDVFTCWIDIDFVNQWKRVAYMALAEAIADSY